MSKANKTFRIRTTINPTEKFINVDFTQQYDKMEILSLELNQTNSYKFMNSNTGIVIGRVLANEGFGIPNAKLSVFVKYDSDNDIESQLKYYYSISTSKDENGIKYNLLPDTVNDDCQQAVGTFPNKRFLLDNNDVIEVFDTYYKYTTRTNNSGDYMIYGVPTGQQTIHCDIDLSDIGVLSQTPRDMIYKGYDKNLFESPSKFKHSTNLSYLPQIISQDNSTFVYPFWGDTTDGETGAAITRCDVNIAYKFEPTCVFLGSVITDTGDNAISKKCVPSKLGGRMSEMTTGSGVIEMIRKTVNGDIEQISVKGNELINEDGTWCYQIPMNLDYIMTDEYGNTVLSDNPNKGIPTRTTVRFRVSMHENPADGIAKKRARYLIPNNPQLVSNNHDTYEFGSNTKDDDFRDLMWNNVYTVKNYVPRVQKSLIAKNWKFTGIKMVNHANGKNPTPYNKLTIRFNFMYTFLCVLIKMLVRLTSAINAVLSGLALGFYKIGQWLINVAYDLGNTSGSWWKTVLTLGGNKIGNVIGKLFIHVDKTVEDEDDKTNIDVYNVWNNKPTHPFRANGCDYPSDDDKAGVMIATIKWIVDHTPTDSEGNKKYWDLTYDIEGIDGLGVWFIRLTIALARGIELKGLCSADDDEEESIARPGIIKPITRLFYEGKYYKKNVRETIYPCLKILADAMQLDDLYNCIENQLVQEHEVTSFNFHNDWLNGVLYMPLWYRRIKPKKKFLFIKIKGKDQWCDADRRVRGSSARKLKLYSNNVIKRTYSSEQLNPLADDYQTVNVLSSVADDETGIEVMAFRTLNDTNCYGYKCHKRGISHTPLSNGLVVEKETMLGDHVYYYRPVYADGNNEGLVTLFATDIVLLGSLNTCDLHGIPQFFKILEGTTYQMPPDLLSSDPNVTGTKELTEFTGADWGNLGDDQSNYIRGMVDANENIYDNGGLFYGINCFTAYTKPKTIINLERICEVGVTLDESKEILKTQAFNAQNITTPGGQGNSNHLMSADADDIYTELTPDGYISFDEIYNPDYRSMFATMNGNRLKTKLNMETGLTEYDLVHVYTDNFDGSLSKIMAGPTTHGQMIIQNASGNIPTGQLANYVNNSNLERFDRNYTLFRFGDYKKETDKKIYFYTYNGVGEFLENKIPRYENSFYFYFGLFEGKTAIDRFYSDYYADCSSNVEFEPAINISHVGNGWCSNTGGYIKFDCNLDLPINMTMVNLDTTPVKQFAYNDIASRKFYVGTNMGTNNDVTGYSYVNVLGDTETALPHGRYKITLEDGNGDEHEIIYDFQNDDVVTAEVSVLDFNVPNSMLPDISGLADNELYDDNGNLTEKFYQTIANIGADGHITGVSQSNPMDRILIDDVESTRTYGGVITISDISLSNACFSIFVEPQDPTLVGGFTGTYLLFDDNGRITSVENTGYGYLGNSEDGNEYYIGVPYGNITYNVTIQQHCDDGNTLSSTGNIMYRTVVVNEGQLSMLINGIDYQLIHKFKTGWTGGSLNNTSGATFNQNNIVGWNEMDNIGVDNVDNYTDDDTIENMYKILSGQNPDPSPYTWTEQYMMASDFMDNLDITNDDDKTILIDEINRIVDLRRELSRQMIGAFRPNMYGKCEITVRGITRSLPVKYLLINKVTK